MVVAAAIAIALHEILAALIPGSVPQSSPREVVARAEVVRIAQRHVPAPARPIPIAPIRRAPQRIAPPQRRRAVSHGAAQPAPAHRSAVARVTGKPVWDVAAGTGAASTAGNAPGTQAAGVTAGNEGDAGAPASDEPCGFVEFSDPHGSRYDAATRGFFVDIRMSVHFADGSRQSLILDYPWYYANESANPWSAQNLKDASFPTRFQAPPGAQLANEPQLVQYVAQHSTVDGMTLLRDCQGASERRP